MPAFHPGAGEGGVVDQAHFGEPAQDGVGDLVRDPPLAQRGGQLCPRARPAGEQPQADKPRRLLAPGVGTSRLHVAGRGASGASAARTPAPETPVMGTPAIGKLPTGNPTAEAVTGILDDGQPAGAPLPCGCAASGCSPSGL